MTRRRKELGEWGENLASAYLQDQGYTIVARNYRSSLGELDIIAMEKDVLVFVEVRTKSNQLFGTAEESITAKKQRKLRQLALQYLTAGKQRVRSWRIDVVTVEVGPDNTNTVVRHIKSAL